MHGRKRPAAGVKPAADEAAAAAKKIATYKQLLGLAMKHKATSARGDHEFLLNGKLLRANPDVYSLWNHRRECILDKLKDTAADCDGRDERAKAVTAVELEVTQAAIEKNPKSYPAWHHRQWTVHRFAACVDMKRELALCATLLDADERNFHCWNYRRWLARFSRVAAEEELAYTTKRIHMNFSNYSAWHYRTHLLLEIHGAAVKERDGSVAEAGGDAASCPAASSAAEGGAPSNNSSSDAIIPLSVLGEELELIRQAVFTEPDDQSPWFYRRWLLQMVERHLVVISPVGACSDSDCGPRKQAMALLDEDVAALRELHSAEPSSKWPLVGIVQALELQLKCAHNNDSNGGDAATALRAQLRDIYAQLERLDPTHGAYYRYACASATSVATL